MNKDEIDYLAQSLANKYFMTNLLFRIWDRWEIAHPKKVQPILKQPKENDEPLFADYYR